MEFTYLLEDLPAIAKQIVANRPASQVWIFEGEMGAGKTTLIKEICRELGVQDAVQSPTFSLVNEYRTTCGETIYHFDCYRLKNDWEALDFGIEEYLYSGTLCLIEWPSKIDALLPQNIAKFDIQLQTSGARKLIVTEVE